MLTVTQTLGQLIARLMDEQGVKAKDLAATLGLHPSNMGRKIKGEIAITYAERVKIARAFGYESIEDFDELWHEAAQAGPRGIPVINRAPAGEVIDYNHQQSAEAEFHDAWQYIDRGLIGAEDAFAVIVVGDSMEPTLYSGDLCVFLPVFEDRKDRQPQPRQIVFVRFTDDGLHQGCCLCRLTVLEDGKWLLTKDNAKYPPKIVRPEDVARLAILSERRTKRM
jgi:phage repressor protein C with HTH and peptisase S24 domain